MPQAIEIIEAVKNLEQKRLVIDWEAGLKNDTAAPERSNAKPWEYIHEKAHPHAVADEDYFPEAIICFKLSGIPSRVWLAAFEATLRENFGESYQLEWYNSDEINLEIPMEGVKILGRDTKMLGISRHTIERLMEAIRVALIAANQVASEAANKAQSFDTEALFAPSKLNPSERQDEAMEEM